LLWSSFKLVSYGLFNDAASSTDYTASKIRWLLILKARYYPTTCLTKKLWTTGLKVGIRQREGTVSNKTQQCYQHDYCAEFRKHISFIMKVVNTVWIIFNFGNRNPWRTEWRTGLF
jgi:hypothetical protein